MAGSITFSYSADRHGTVQVVTFDWTCTAGGAVSGVLSAPVNGVINRAVTVPDGGGTQPADLYDVTLKDEWGFDLLGGSGANRSQTATEEIVPTSRAVAGTLELTVANAGNAKGGTLILLLT